MTSQRRYTPEPPTASFKRRDFRLHHKGTSARELHKLEDNDRVFSKSILRRVRNCAGAGCKWLCSIYIFFHDPVDVPRWTKLMALLTAAAAVREEWLTFWFRSPNFTRTELLVIYLHFRKHPETVPKLLIVFRFPPNILINPVGVFHRIITVHFK